MAIRKEIIDLMDIACKSMDKKFKDIKICELGNQYTKDHPDYKTGKQYLTALGAEHVSIDLNGKDGALKIDLAKPIEKWDCYFDMVTNYGTSEHVNNQYQAFRNMHNFTKVNGTIVHGGAPAYGHWPTHGYCNYELCFFEYLADLNNYDLVLSEMREKWSIVRKKMLDLVCVVFCKKDDKPFISLEEFQSIEGLKMNEPKK